MIPLLLTIAALVVGHPVQVTCETPGQWAADPHVAAGGGPDQVVGYTEIGGASGNPVSLAPATCGALVLLSLDPHNLQRRDADAMPTWQWFPTEAEALAVLALGHELTHSATGTLDELAAECGGLAAMPAILQALGAAQQLDGFRSIAVAEISRQRPGASCS